MTSILSQNPKLPVYLSQLHHDLLFDFLPRSLVNGWEIKLTCKLFLLIIYRLIGVPVFHQDIYYFVLIFGCISQFDCCVQIFVFIFRNVVHFQLTQSSLGIRVIGPPDRRLRFTERLRSTHLSQKIIIAIL